MELFAGLGAIWLIGFGGYMFFRRKDKYNNLRYYNVTDKLRKYKRVRDKMSGNDTKFFK